MNKLEALLSHDQTTSSTIASFESDNPPPVPTTPTTRSSSPTSSLSNALSIESNNSNLPSLILPQLSSPSASLSPSNTQKTGDESVASARGRTLSAMSMDQMREKVSNLSMRRRKLQKVQSASVLVSGRAPTMEVPLTSTSQSISLNSSSNSTNMSSPQPSTTVNKVSPHKVESSSSTITMTTPERSTVNTPSSSVVQGTLNTSPTNSNVLSPSSASIGPSTTGIDLVIPSPTKLVDTSKWDDSNYTLVVGGVVYVRMDYVKRQVEEIMNKYSNARREFKDRERVMKKHFEKMDQEKSEKLEYCMKEFEEKCVSVQIKCREAFLKKYNDKVDELTEKIRELSSEKEDLKNRLEKENKKMSNDMHILVSNVESKMKQNVNEYHTQQEELKKVIRIQKKLFFGLLSYVRSKEMPSLNKDIGIQTEELVQDLELEQYRRQVEELKYILDMEQCEFQKVYVEKETHLINELNQSKHQLAQLESCMKEQTNVMKELESQLSGLNVETDPSSFLKEEPELKSSVLEIPKHANTRSVSLKL